VTESSRRDRLSQAELRRALLLIALAWGVFGSMWANTVSGAPFAAYARKLGATTLVYGLMASLPFLGTLAQIPGAYIVERTRRRKPLFVWSCLIARASWLVAAALPWLFADAGPRVVGLMAVVFLSAALGNLGSPGWLSWFGDVVPARTRGKYIGVRARLATLMGMIAALAAGYALDRSSAYWMYTVVLGVAALLGVSDTLLLFGVREPHMTGSADPPRLMNIVLGPLRDEPFRRYLAYAASSALCQWIIAPFVWLFALEYLGLGKLTANLYLMVLPLAAMTVLFPLWGGLVDRYGCRPTLTLSWIGMSIFPVAWFFATPVGNEWLAIVGVVTGAFSAGMQVAEFDLMFSMTPAEQRSAYLASVAVASGLAATVAPAVGGAVGQALRGLDVSLWGLQIGNLHVLLLLAVVLRVVHIVYFVPRLAEADAKPAKRLAGDLLRMPFQALGIRRSLPEWAPWYRIHRRRRRPPEGPRRRPPGTPAGSEPPSSPGESAPSP